MLIHARLLRVTCFSDRRRVFGLPRVEEGLPSRWIVQTDNRSDSHPETFSDDGGKEVEEVLIEKTMVAVKLFA